MPRPHMQGHGGLLRFDGKDGSKGDEGNKGEKGMAGLNGVGVSWRERDWLPLHTVCVCFTPSDRVSMAIKVLMEH